MITTYQEAKEYLESLIKPIPYKNLDKDLSSYDPLDRMRTLLSLLDNPEKKFKSIQVSGTSGKGSTAYLLSHLLTTAGYKTGFTLSPHLLSITERFQINEQPISEESFISLINEVVPVVSTMKEMTVGEPTYFEALMSLVFLCFAREKVDIAVVEVGLEGRYDGTNTLDPLLFILTNISLDHTEFLGDTEDKIAMEATAAIKEGQVVISGVTQKNIQEVVEKVCDEKHAVLRLYNKHFWVEVKEVREEGVLFDYHPREFCLHELFMSLVGEYQAMNAVLALEAAFALKEFGFIVPKERMYEALKTAQFSGRFEKVTPNPHDPSLFSPAVFLDGAHNPAKMEAFVHSFQKIYPDETCIVIFACKQHKDISQMVKHLASITDTLIVTQYFTTTDASKNSSMSVADVRSQVEQLSPVAPVLPADTIGEAIQAARVLATKQKKNIVITGSLYLVGEAKHYLNEQG
jgi:dihydrofolate synthase/folylpolyglutamate synthase